MVIKAIKCTICVEVISKYKCPKCQVDYCSVSCYKAHKASCSCVKNTPVVIVKAEETEEIHENVNKNEEFDKLSEDSLSKLKSNEELKELLSNEHLRNLLQQLDSSSNKEADLSKLMKEPIFTEFTNECLSTIKKGSEDV